MNIFTTEHPLTSQPSWSDAKAHPRLSFVCRVVVSGLIFTPLILLGLYFYFTRDIGAEPRPFPEPWFDLANGSIFSFLIAIVFGALIVASYPCVMRIWRRIAA